MGLLDKPDGVTVQDLVQLGQRMRSTGLLVTCLTCEHFEEFDVMNNPSELCKVYKVRPPARVIALGCESWRDVIPF